MSKKLEEKDFYLVYNSYQDHYYSKELNILYLPLIGINAIKMYDYFFNKILNDTNISINSLHYEITETFGLSIEQFVLIRKKLEALGLLRTYFFEKENKIFYIYKILKPLTFEEFFANELLSGLLKNTISAEEYELITKKYNTEKLKFDNFSEITAKFSQVYSSDEEKIISKEIIRENNYGPNLDEYYFDFSKLNYLLSNNYLDIILEDNNLKKTILELAHLYKTTPEDMAVAIEKSISEESSGTEVNIKELKEYLMQLYLNIKKQDNTTLDERINKKLVQDTYNNYKELSKEERVAKKFDSMNYIEFLNKKWGIILSEIDIKNIILKLQEKYKFSSGVLNILLDYGLKKSGSNGLPNYNYLDKIASSWSSKRFVSAIDVMKFLNSRSANYKKDFKQYKTASYNMNIRKKNNFITTPDYIKEQLNSLNGQSKEKEKIEDISQNDFKQLLKEKGID